MPNLQENKNELEKEQIATTISEHLELITASERAAVAVACGVHDDTVRAYASNPAKLPVARRILAELKRVTADRQVNA